LSGTIERFFLYRCSDYFDFTKSDEFLLEKHGFTKESDFLKKHSKKIVKIYPPLPPTSPPLPPPKKNKNHLVGEVVSCLVPVAFLPVPLVI
jgi:hypothetical protein